MATTIKLKSDIKKLKGALTSKGLSASIKTKLKAQLEKAQNELASMQKGAKPRKTSTTKGTQSALANLKALIKKKKYSVYKGAGVDLKKDSEEPALPIGKRESQGLKGNQYGSKKASKGNVYYEYRANRLDVKQPSKTARYPKLEDGGMMAKGGELSVFEKNQIRIAKDTLKMSDVGASIMGGMTKEEAKKILDKYKVKYADGGMMANGGKLKFTTMTEESFLEKYIDTNVYPQSVQNTFDIIRYGSNDKNKLDGFLSAMKLNGYKVKEEGGFALAVKKRNIKEDGGMMAKGGNLSDAQVIAKLEKKFANKELDEDFDFDENGNFKVDGYNVEVFDWKEEDEKDEYIKKHSKDNYLVPYHSDDDNYYIIVVPKNKMAQGGVTEKEVVESNAQMVLSQIKAVKHHADELAHIVSTKSDIEAWVVAKIERASTDLSDITHYLDGQHQKMSMGGSVYNYTHKMDKK